MGQQGAEFLLVQRLVVGVFRRNAFHAHVLHDVVVQRLVAVFFADLDHAGNLVGLAFAHQVGDGGVEDQDFKRRDAAFLVRALEQGLRHDAFQGFGKRLADLVLLVGGKHVNDTVHGLGGALGVQGAEDQVARWRRR